MEKLVLIGGGGHARVVMDALATRHIRPGAYCDSNAQSWLEALGVASITQEKLALQLPLHAAFIMGFLGVTVEALMARRQKMLDLQAAGGRPFTVIHKTAIISRSAIIEEGAQVLTGAIVQAGARIGAGAVINTGAVIEHGVIVHAGAHVAPRAVVLGDATVGECSFVGSGAVLVQQAMVPDQQFVKSLTTYR